jgi:hypothetical protein
MRKPQTFRSTIKNDPFASVIPIPTELELPKEAKPKEAKLPVKKPERISKPINLDERVYDSNETKSGKQKLTVHLPFDLADRVKNAAYWNPRLTIAGIAEQGIKYAIEKFERENGGRYEQRDGELLGGRPIK